MFTGMYIPEIKKRKCNFPFGGNGDLFTVLCVEDTNEEIFVKMIPEIYAERLEFEGKILEVYETEKKDDSILIPEKFIEYLNGSEAVLLGVGQAAEMVKKEDYEASLNNLDTLLDDLDF